MVIIEDVNQKIGKHTEKNEYWQKKGDIVIRNKLPLGDYCLMPEIVIDTKNGIEEVYLDMYSEHKRWQQNFINSKQWGVKLIILIENDLGITCLEEIPKKWENPLIKKYKNEFIWKLRKKGIKCTSEQDVWAIYKMCKENGIQTRRPPCSEEQLMKSMITCQKNEEYSVSFEFCSKVETGKKIIELLTRQ